MKIEFYEPPMCCSTGLCGPAPDKTLVQLSQNINKLQVKYPDLIIERYMISKQPLKFQDNQGVFQLVKEHSKDILPITTINGKVFKTHQYPTFDELMIAIEGETK